MPPTPNATSVTPLNTPLSYHILDTVSVTDIVVGGNAGLAATYCAQQLKKPIQVIVPESTPVNVVKKLEKNGADVLVFGKVIMTHYNGATLQYTLYLDP